MGSYPGYFLPKSAGISPQISVSHFNIDFSIDAPSTIFLLFNKINRSAFLALESTLYWPFSFYPGIAVRESE
jgi:hypothetical protein